MVKMEQQIILDFLNRINKTKIRDIDIEQDIEMIKEIINDWDNPESKSNNDIKVAEFYALRGFFHKYACQLYDNNTPAKYMDVSDRECNHYSPTDNTIYYQKNAQATMSNAMTLIFECLHENRHAVQFSQFKKNPDEILKIDPLSIVMLKELYLRNNHQDLYEQYHNNFILENDASLCAEVQLRHIISQYLESNPKYFEQLKINANRENKNYNTAMQHAETNASLRFNTSEFGVLPVLYQADKDLKDNISTQDIQKYPLLQLICNENGTLKTYEEIIEDRERHKLEYAEEPSQQLISSNTGYENKSFSNNTQIDRIYQFIINSDSMLYMEDCLRNNRTNQVEELFVDAPEVIYSYNDRIIELVSKYGTLENYKRFMTYYKEEQNNLQQERAKVVSQIGNLIRENKQHPIRDYQEQLNELVRKKDNITNALEQVNEGINNFNSMVSEYKKESQIPSKDIITGGVESGIEANITTGQINESTETIVEQEQINQLLEELNDCIEFLDTNQMNDRMYLEILKRHRGEYDDPYDAVIQADLHYKRNKEKEVDDDVEKIDETEHIDR